MTANMIRRVSKAERKVVLREMYWLKTWTMAGASISAIPLPKAGAGAVAADRVVDRRLPDRGVQQKRVLPYILEKLRITE